VGPTGKAYGLDMTDEMLALARETNAVVLKTSRFPQRRNRTDPAADIPRISSFRTASLTCRDTKDGAGGRSVLKAGGPIRGVGVVVNGRVRRRFRRSMECGSAASRAHSRGRISQQAAAAGFTSIETSRRDYSPGIAGFLSAKASMWTALAPQIEGKFGAFIARKARFRLCEPGVAPRPNRDPAILVPKHYGMVFL